MQPMPKRHCRPNCGCMLASESAVEFVLKVTRACNLTCPGCYEKLGASRMSPRVVDKLLSRLSEHCARYPGAKIAVVLHGGEPMCFGTHRIEQLVSGLYDQIGANRVGVKMQTNGTLITPGIARRLSDLNISVGVSIDGLAPAHNAARPLSTRGKLSFDLAMRGFSALKDAGALTKWLCVINPQQDDQGKWLPEVDPVKTTEFLLGLGAPDADFILPHATWDKPPRNPALYAKWLIEAAQVYWSTPSQGRTRIRLFEEMCRLMAGDCMSALFGLGITREPMFVDTLGRYCLHDSLRIIDTPGIEIVKWPYPSVDGIAHGDILSVDNADVDSFVLALLQRNSELGIQRLLQDGRPDLCSKCMSCPLMRQCGGGLFSHRYSSKTTDCLETGFRNPSVWCDVLHQLFMWHINALMLEQIKLDRTVFLPYGWWVDSGSPKTPEQAEAIILQGIDRFGCH